MRFAVRLFATLTLFPLAAFLHAGDFPDGRIPVAEALSPQQDSPQARYVANAGVLVTVNAHQFLIDAPIREGIAPYPTSPADERQRLEAARPPYENIDAILITHWHADHFSPEAIAAHLMHNSRVLLVSSPQVVERVRAATPSLSSDRLRAVLPAPGQSQELRVGGVAVRVLRLRHNPSRNFPEQHVGFLIGDANPVLHVGDADPKADNFALLRRLPKVDIAFLPFWYVMHGSNRRFVTESIAPSRIVAMHLPAEEAPQLASDIRDVGMKIVLPPAPGSPMALDK
jgi:L-ascorbate metabolism protein UlaG (beta-lactamase superfamily)